MMSKNTQFVASWAAVSIVAESTGAAVALSVAAVSWAGAIPVVLLEAFLLAGGQRWVLRGRHAGLERGWFFATLAGTLLGRGVQFAAEGSGIAAAVATMPTAVQAAFGALLGALVGALMAAPQAFMLRRRIKQAGRWVAIRALAWSIGLPSLLLAGAWIANMSAYGITGLVVLAIFASFALVGAFVGLVEGYALSRLMRLVVDWQVRLAAMRRSRRSGPHSRRSKRLPAAGASGFVEHIAPTIR
jgi:hypothetical protein